ncbi:hypothetical protein CRG98_020533 [Punica granatum]|uniref:Uncharacterized protein n=1 Tax=Punica granatum TaxID=22663 RepID=A0A2I0JRZ3_PUNGR|nr:hypothetical protein CRG98_020533 [Punica granatum]
MGLLTMCKHSCLLCWRKSHLGWSRLIGESIEDGVGVDNLITFHGVPGLRGALCDYCPRSYLAAFVACTTGRARLVGGDGCSRETIVLMQSSSLKRLCLWLCGGYFFVGSFPRQSIGRKTR